MDTFPVLKSGAVAQYGSDRRRRFSTQVFRFVDGSEQRFPGYATSLKKWVIRLELLDENELSQLARFFSAHSGRGGVFTFTDPWDGVTYPSCSFDHDVMISGLRGRSRGHTSVTVRENRG